MVSTKIAELGENIVIRRFTRYLVGEPLGTEGARASVGDRSIIFAAARYPKTRYAHKRNLMRFLFGILGLNLVSSVTPAAR